MMFKHLLLAVPLLAAGCAAPRPFGSSDLFQSPALYDKASPLKHRSPLAGYESRTPTDPKSWRQLNDAQSTKGGHS